MGSQGSLREGRRRGVRVDDGRSLASCRGETEEWDEGSGQTIYVLGGVSEWGQEIASERRFRHVPSSGCKLVDTMMCVRNIVD